MMNVSFDQGADGLSLSDVITSRRAFRQTLTIRRKIIESCSALGPLDKSVFWDLGHTILLFVCLQMDSVCIFVSSIRHFLKYFVHMRIICVYCLHYDIITSWTTKLQ